MNVKAYQWIAATVRGPSDRKFVLSCIALNTDAEGAATISIADLSCDTSMPTEDVRLQLARLCAARLLDAPNVQVNRLAVDEPFTCHIVGLPIGDMEAA